MLFKNKKRSHHLKKLNTIDLLKPHLIKYDKYSKDLKAHKKVDAR